MKKALKILAGLAMIATIAAALMFAESTRKSESYNTLPAVSNAYRYELTAGSITNAENDTIAVPAQFLDAWVPSVWLETTRASGTMAINLILQENSTLTGTSKWVSVDTVAIGNAATGAARLDYPFAPYHMRGLRARVIIDGSGTQSVTYTGRFVAKRTE